MTEYFLEKKIGNEKKWIKEKFFKNRIIEDGIEKKYIRGLLGITDNIEFRDKERRGKIGIKSKEIERYKSPITFEVLRNNETKIIETNYTPRFSNHILDFQ